MRTQFSVLIPVHNRAEHVRQAVESVLAQTFKNYELIVIDDGSTDGTPAVLASYGSRVQVLRQENQGPGGRAQLGEPPRRGVSTSFCCWIATIFCTRPRWRPTTRSFVNVQPRP